MRVAGEGSLWWYGFCEERVTTVWYMMHGCGCCGVVVSWACGGGIIGSGGRGVYLVYGELHYLLDKVVQAGTALGPNSNDHNVNTITNGDGMRRVRIFRETISPE
ncbi:hypothetical protein Tco_0230957 [Tanacetum coccineum]